MDTRRLKTRTEQRVLGERYQLPGCVIAAGGMGVVYEATDPVLGRNVAIKILSETASADPDARRRFTREAHAAARIAHPNAVAVFDAGEQDGRPYIVMERLSGRTIADEIKAGPLSAVRVRKLASELLGVLAQAHSLGIIHRDIKPTNVLVDDTGAARVTDFGIATILDSTVRTTELLGTPSYVAPELLMGSHPSAQSDLFGVGVLLYESLTACKPFGSGAPFEIIDRMRRGEFNSLSFLAPEVDLPLRAAIERAMNPDPTKRFRSAEEMIRALDFEPPNSLVEPTRKLQYQSDAETIALPNVQRRRIAWDRRHATFALLLLAIAAGFIFIASLGPAHKTSQSVVRPAAATHSSSLPMPLESALQKLDRSVGNP